MTTTIRMQQRTPVAVKVMGQGRKRRVLLTAKGRLAFPDVTMEEIRAEGAYAALGGGSSRSYTVLKEYRRVCALGNVSSALPQPLFLAAMDGFAVKVLREITRAIGEGKKHTVVDRHQRRFFSEQCRRAFRHCFAACHYPNYNYDVLVAKYTASGHTRYAEQTPHFCGAVCGCRAGFNAAKNASVTRFMAGYTYPLGYSANITFDWSWFRDVYLRGLAVVENHMVLRYLETLSPQLHRVTVVVQEQGVNAFHEEERIVWQTGEGLLLLRP